MSKLIAAGTAALGGTATAVGGSYLLQKANSFENTPTTQPQLLFDSVDKFKKEAKDFDCVKKYFKNGDTGIDIEAAEKGDKEFNTTSPAEGSFFKDEKVGSTIPYESCLVVNWKTETYSESGNKGTGTFTWIGTFVRGNEGFINFNIAQTSSSAQELEFKGVFYLLEKGSGSSYKWEIKHKKEVKDSPKKVADGQVDQYFPKVGKEVTIGDDKKDYGGFFPRDKKSEKMQNICGTNDCQTTTKDSKVEIVELSGTGSSGATKLIDGSNDLNGGSKIYEITPGSLSTKIGSYVGTGTPNTTKK